MIKVEMQGCCTPAMKLMETRTHKLNLAILSQPIWVRARTQRYPTGIVFRVESDSQILIHEISSTESTIHPERQSLNPAPKT